MENKCSIVGGGIAGLTTAIALKNVGIECEIFEAAPVIKAIGAGLVLGANAIKAFQKIGISEDVIKCGRSLPFFTICDEKGKKIIRTDNGLMSKQYGVSNFTISRASLHNLLLSKLDSKLIHTGARVSHIEQTDGLVTTKFQNGTIHKSNYVIAADGINSAIRLKLLPEALPRYAGYTCWRAIIDATNLNITETSETWGTNGRFGIVPLTENKIYWFACVNAPQNNKEMREMSVKDLQVIFKEFHAPIQDILNATKDENILWNDIVDLKPINHYAFNNIVLVGDAAHATTPNMGQGACQAIEDAAILADEMKKNSDFKNAFKNFEQRRVKRTHFIINRSRSIGYMAQTNNRLFAELRNLAFRLTPDFISRFQFKKIYDVRL